MIQGFGSGRLAFAGVRGDAMIYMMLGMLMLTVIALATLITWAEQDLTKPDAGNCKAHL